MSSATTAPTASSIHDQLVELLAEHASLTYEGFGLWCTPQERRDRVGYLERMCKSRVYLLHSTCRQNIAELMVWIDQWMAPRKTFNDMADSYYLKHVAERMLGHYCSNGEFICAALLAGYRHEHRDINPNVVFNMRSGSIRQATRTANRVKPCELPIPV